MPPNCSVCATTCIYIIPVKCSFTLYDTNNVHKINNLIFQHLLANQDMWFLIDTY